MPDYEISLNIVKLGKIQGQAVLKAWESLPEYPDQVLILVDYQDERFEAKSDKGFFQAFKKIRTQLEEKGLLAHCLASARNVYPSPMAEDMGPAIMAYKTFKGKQAKSKDLVNIFEFDPESVPATVKEQEEFHQEWLRSLSERPLAGR